MGIIPDLFCIAFDLWLGSQRLFTLFLTCTIILSCFVAPAACTHDLCLGDVSVLYLYSSGQCASHVCSEKYNKLTPDHICDFPCEPSETFKEKLGGLSFVFQRCFEVCGLIAIAGSVVIVLEDLGGSLRTARLAPGREIAPQGCQQRLSCSGESYQEPQRPHRRYTRQPAPQITFLWLPLRDLPSEPASSPGGAFNTATELTWSPAIPSPHFLRHFRPYTADLQALISQQLT